MRKVVKRSLLLWPTAASATIIAVSWFQGRSLPELWSEHAAGVSAQPRFVLEQPLAPHQEIQLPEFCEVTASPLERTEQGARGIELPPRVAVALGVHKPAAVPAPIRDERQELAGLSPLWLQHDESLAASSASNPLGIVGPVRPVVMATVGPVDVSLNPPQQGLPQPADRAVAQSAIPSLLPASNRALGRLIADSGPVAESRAVADDTVHVGDLPSVQLDIQSQLVARGASAATAWPRTQDLDQQLSALSVMAGGPTIGSRDQLVSSLTSRTPQADWSADVRQQLDQLQTLPRLGDPRAGELIGELAQLTAQGITAAEQLSDRQQQVQWLRAAHALDRRVAVWRPIWEVTSNAQQPATWMVTDAVADPSASSIDAAIASVRSQLQATGDDQGWSTYLMLDRLAAANRTSDPQGRALLAQRFLSRLQWHALSSDQRDWLQHDSIDRLADAVRPWAHNAIDYVTLVEQLERQESDSIDLASVEIAEAIQSLRFADNPDAVRVAEALDLYYRNANVRLAISGPLLNRLLPSIDSQSVPVRTQMMGSRIRGVSRIDSDLQVALTPAKDRWAIELKTLGNVRTQSTGFNGPVAVRTSGNSNFVAATPIEITPTGIQIGDSNVSVRGSTRLRGIRSDYDGWPLIGTLVRNIASSKFDSISGESNRLANRKISDQVKTEIDTQLDNRVQTASQRLSSTVLGPLGKLQLDPRVVDMQTTEDRLLARYRLAGDWQMAAYTPRPRAPRESLMSVQVHQSAINNTLAQLVPCEEPMPIATMVQQAAEVFGQQSIEIPDDVPADVTIQFAQTRPITVEIEDGLVWLTLRIVRLSNDDRLDLTKFIVRAAYKPEIDGIEARLVREGHLRISGPNMSMRERLPVRAIFNKVLSSNRPLPLTLPQLADHPAADGLVVSQLELRGGWLALAISEDTAPRIALAE